MQLASGVSGDTGGECRLALKRHIMVQDSEGVPSETREVER